MQFADGPALSFREPGTRHREGDIRFKYLLRGEAGSPCNYELSLVRTGERFYGPPHRHNFDQIRYVVSGTFGEPGKLELRSGEIGYYPEGTPYQIDSSDSEVLVLQFGGASGFGFTHYEQLRSHYPVLAGKGEFKDGLFRWHEPPAGKPRQQDGYEALWELINGKPLTYPKQRYRHPVLMNPAAFEWVESTPGLAVRTLGRFTERDIGVSQLQVAAGATSRIDSGGTIRLLYVLEGYGQLGEHAVRTGCALELPAGGDIPVTADTTLLLLALDLPRFASDRTRSAAMEQEVTA